MRCAGVASAGLAALALAGCAPITLSPAPAAPPRLVQTPRPTPLATAQARHEYPGPAVHETAAGSSRDPVEAVLAFASAYINWTASTVAADMHGLAQRSVGQARAAMQLAAAQTGQDYELARAGVANQGTVEAIAPLAGHADEYAVVTLERTTATDSTAYAGLTAAWHVAVATVTEMGPGRWVLSGWQPEN